MSNVASMSDLTQKFGEFKSLFGEEEREIARNVDADTRFRYEADTLLGGKYQMKGFVAPKFSFFDKIQRLLLRVFKPSDERCQALKDTSRNFYNYVEKIFGKGRIPESVKKAMGVHNRSDGIMRPLTARRIRAVRDKIDKELGKLENANLRFIAFSEKLKKNEKASIAVEDLVALRNAGIVSDEEFKGCLTNQNATLFVDANGNACNANEIKGKFEEFLNNPNNKGKPFLVPSNLLKAKSTNNLGDLDSWYDFYARKDAGEEVQPKVGNESVVEIDNNPKVDKKAEKSNRQQKLMTAFHLSPIKSVNDKNSGIHSKNYGFILNQINTKIGKDSSKVYNPVVGESKETFSQNYVSLKGAKNCGDLVKDQDHRLQHILLDEAGRLFFVSKRGDDKYYRNIDTSDKILEAKGADFQNYYGFSMIAKTDTGMAADVDCTKFELGLQKNDNVGGEKITVADGDPYMANNGETVFGDIREVAESANPGNQGELVCPTLMMLAEKNEVLPVSQPMLKRLAIVENHPVVLFDMYSEKPNVMVFNQDFKGNKIKGVPLCFVRNSDGTYASVTCDFKEACKTNAEFKKVVEKLGGMAIVLGEEDKEDEEDANKEVQVEKNEALIQEKKDTEDAKKWKAEKEKYDAELELLNADFSEIKKLRRQLGKQEESEDEAELFSGANREHYNLIRQEDDTIDNKIRKFGRKFDISNVDMNTRFEEPEQRVQDDLAKIKAYYEEEDMSIEDGIEEVRTETESLKKFRKEEVAKELKTLKEELEEKQRKEALNKRLSTFKKELSGEKFINAMQTALKTKYQAEYERKYIDKYGEELGKKYSEVIMSLVFDLIGKLGYDDNFVRQYDQDIQNLSADKSTSGKFTLEIAETYLKDKKIPGFDKAFKDLCQKIDVHLKEVEKSGESSDKPDLVVVNAAKKGFQHLINQNTKNPKLLWTYAKTLGFEYEEKDAALMAPVVKKALELALTRIFESSDFWKELNAATAVAKYASDSGIYTRKQYEQTINQQIDAKFIEEHGTAYLKQMMKGISTYAGGGALQKVRGKLGDIFAAEFKNYVGELGSFPKMAAKKEKDFGETVYEPVKGKNYDTLDYKDVVSAKGTILDQVARDFLVNQIDRVSTGNKTEIKIDTATDNELMTAVKEIGGKNKYNPFDWSTFLSNVQDPNLKAEIKDIKTKTENMVAHYLLIGKMNNTPNDKLVEDFIQSRDFIVKDSVALYLGVLQAWCVKRMIVRAILMNAALGNDKKYDPKQDPFKDNLVTVQKLNTLRSYICTDWSNKLKDAYGKKKEKYVKQKKDTVEYSEKNSFVRFFTSAPAVKMSEDTYKESVLGLQGFTSALFASYFGKAVGVFADPSLDQAGFVNKLKEIYNQSDTEADLDKLINGEINLEQLISKNKL